MASLQLRSGSWRVIFRHRGLQHFVTVGEVDETEAEGVKARYEYLLRLIKQRLLTLPSGMDIVTFLRHDGKATDTVDVSPLPDITFAVFRDGYLKTIGNGAVENKWGFSEPPAGEDLIPLAGSPRAAQKNPVELYRFAGWAMGVV